MPRWNMLKTFKYRLRPTPAQEQMLRTTLDECRWLYNHLLEQRRFFRCDEMDLARAQRRLS